VAAGVEERLPRRHEQFRCMSHAPLCSSLTLYAAPGLMENRRTVVIPSAWHGLRKVCPGLCRLRILLLPVLGCRNLIVAEPVFGERVTSGCRDASTPATEKYLRNLVPDLIFLRYRCNF